MKTIAKILAVIAAAACMAVVGIGCGPKGYVDKSNAVELGAFDRPDYAREMEEKHDREGREHIEIPDGAKTITIDGEEYIPISTLREMDQPHKNYIMKCDIDLNGTTGNIGTFSYPFHNKFNGNNYKFYGRQCTAIFGKLEGAEISNVILSSKLENTGVWHDTRYSGSILADFTRNSVFKNCINYAKAGKGDNGQMKGLIGELVDGTVENCINYADMQASSGMVNTAFGDFVIKNCENYGNISSGGSCSGILCYSTEVYSEAVYDYYNEEVEKLLHYTNGIVENCKNYGKLIGKSNLSGIVGEITHFENIADDQNDIKKYDEVLPMEKMLEKSRLLVKNCENHGDLYRIKDMDISMSGCGGIIGMGGDVEGCLNSGAIYGLESLPPENMMESLCRYVGGIAGAACSVTDCDSTTELQISPQVFCYDKICGYIIKR